MDKSRPLRKVNQELFTDSLIKYRGDQKKAYLDAYPDSSESAAVTSASRLLSNENVRNRFLYKLERLAGCDYWAKKLIALSDAKRGVFHQGQRVDEEPDNTTQMNAVNAYFKVSGIANEPESGDKHVHFHMKSEDIEKLSKAIDKFNDISGSTNGNETQKGD